MRIANEKIMAVKCVICFEKCTSFQEWFVCDRCHEGLVCDVCKKSPLFDHKCPICRKDLYHNEIPKQMYKYRLRTVMRLLYLVTVMLTMLITFSLHTLTTFLLVPIVKYLVATYLSADSPSFAECKLFSCHESNLP